MHMLRLLTILCLALALALPSHAQAPDSIGRIRFKYDFVVPTNGNFVDAIHAANNRPDKSKRYRIFIKSSMYRIKGDGTGRILVIKDSYANCFVPYLTANYADIDVVDFRNYNYGLDQLIADNGYDQILVLYSFDSFKSDPYLYRAGVAG